MLLRLNRQTQQLEPKLAVSWRQSEGGKAITFRLRDGVRFSDGTPFGAEDVVYTFETMMDPAKLSPVGDSFRSAQGAPQARALSTSQVEIRFPAPVAGVERLFDQVTIVSARSPRKAMAALGPFALKEHRAGSYVLLERNPNYWEKDANGRALPYLDAVRLEILQNREMELIRFRRGELHLVNKLDADSFARLAADAPSAARDAGPSLEPEMLWFNQSPQSPLPAHKKAWFQSRAFRRAVSAAINREDLARLVYHGYARPAAGPVPAANRNWVNTSLAPHAYNPGDAVARLEKDGFRLRSGVLRDGKGTAVEFSVITNAGNKAREKMAAMIQQDLAKIGIKLNVVTLDFGSLIERITKTLNYESCLLGLVNLDLDPNAQMNVWLSSGASHQWNPAQKSPATAWEAEIDTWMRKQASTTDPARRKAAFDQVQRIAWEEAPFLYLVTKNFLVGVGPAVRNVQPASLHPAVFWNIERLALAAETSGIRP
ncbi:MAG: ABC transporter substrate-binding protein [Acidobacteria bacterium]|nr:ABC transporter substrate-binding protein [Acidobacteriota bacterium]